MSIDFEKQIREMERGKQATFRTASETDLASPTEEAPEDPTAVHFPLRVWMLCVHGLVICGLVAWIGYSAFSGQLDKSLTAIWVGGGGILIQLGMLPMSLRLDSRGIHQSYFLGLWERSIPWNDVRFYWRTTRGELRRSGLLGYGQRHGGRNKNDHEEVVYVGSKSGKRYLLHTAVHSGRERFMSELERRGVQPKGYEGWEAYMESRGVPVR